MIGVYYPYFKEAATWDELRFSLRSLEKHLKEEFTVYLVGDKPDWIKNVVHIPHKRDDVVYEGMVLTDANRKLELFIDHPSIPERFIRMNDDIYLIDDISVTDLEVTRYIRDWSELRNFASGGSTWRKQVVETCEVLRKCGKEGFVTEHHCPELLEVKKMQHIFCLFFPIENKLQTSTLYFNVYPFEKRIKDRQIERALFFGEGDSEFGFSSDHVLAKIEGKKYLSHNNGGLNQELKDVITGLFPEKSRFEI